MIFLVTFIVGLGLVMWLGSTIRKRNAAYFADRAANPPPEPTIMEDVASGRYSHPRSWFLD